MTRHYPLCPRPDVIGALDSDYGPTRIGQGRRWGKTEHLHRSVRGLKQHTRPIRTAAPLLVAALLVVALAFGSQTRNVFIVNIDGLRSTEGFEAEDLNLPFIWDSLRPLGTLYNNFQNTGVTLSLIHISEPMRPY